MLKVLSKGLQTTYQDLGRLGYRNLGVPLSGVMDQKLAIFANELVRNPSEETVIEFTHMGPSFEIMEDLELAVAGMDFLLSLNGEPILLNQSQKLQAGDVLRIGSSPNFIRGYLSVYGGFKVKKVLGSSSFYPMICPKLKIEKGCIIEIKNPKKNNFKSRSLIFDFSIYETSELEVLKGPEFDFLSLEMQKQLFKCEFKIHPQSNRMGYILDNQIDFSARDIITSPVQPGTVQLTPSGKLIVLMRDAQTTGGYARILQLTEKSINVLAQKAPNKKIVFKFF